MKKKISAFFPAGFCCSLSGCSAAKLTDSVLSVLLLLLGLMLMVLAAVRTYNGIRYNQKHAGNARRAARRVPDVISLCTFLLAALLLLGAVILSSAARSQPDDSKTSPPDTTAPQDTTPPAPPFRPQKTESTDPDRWHIRWEIFENGTVTGSYLRETPISFGDPQDYFALPGVSAFRGNNYRNSPAYGTASVTQKTLSTVWTSDSSVLPGSTWSGSGWTGQPLVVQWDEQTKGNMNLFQEKKAKANLVEVIYATLDGHIYFLDLEDGSYTRDPINIGMCFKGAGSLDPRGYPLLYVGSGDENAQGEKPRMYIISLIDGRILYTYGHGDSLSYRRDNNGWCAFDSSPLVDKETDTLIWPGENGILYTIHLNTVYDSAAGTVSVAPETPVLTRYLTGRSNDENYWLGYEASADIVDGYLYVSENGGMFYCIDLNTMELVWAQDTKDDSNSTPVFERVSSDQGYLYTAPSLHWTRSAGMQGRISIYKLDAVTGQIVWEKPYDVHTVEGVSGGVQSTPLLGKKGSAIDGLIIYTIARTPDPQSGRMVALDTQTGNEVWSVDMDAYAWSSPVAFYTDAGDAYIVACDSAGNALLVDGRTGSVIDTLYLGGLVEASPVVFNNMLVVGTRLKKICGVQIQ